MLYAGTTLFKICFKYSYIDNTVKKLKRKSKSAGNILNYGTSETLRNGIVVEPEHVKCISDHIPQHSKPINDQQLGHYLAGLIDGDGHFSKARQLVIIFSEPDAFLAYNLKTQLGFGSVKKVKGKKAYLLIISNKKGLLRVLNLINNKIRTQHKYDQISNNILNSDVLLDKDFTLNTNNDLNNHWLAGFSDADASFQIKIVYKNLRHKPEIRLNYQIDQKHRDILSLIKDKLGGNIGYRSSQDTYYYGSTSFGSAKNVIGYFDKFNLQSKKHISYLRWRKTYRIIQNKEHLTEQGVNKIKKIKALINKHETTI